MAKAPRSAAILLFDVMGTIVREPFLEDVPRFFATTRDELLPLLSREAWFEFEKGLIDEDTFAQRFFLDGRNFDCEGLKAALAAGYDFIEGIEEVLADLRDAGAVMHVLSNYPVWYQLIEGKLRLSRYLAWTFVSCRTGVRKPDVEAFLGAARALGEEPGRCLFIDDRPANCEAARAAGMQAIQFTGVASLRAALAEIAIVTTP